MKALQGRITTLSSSAKGGKLAKYCMLPQTDEKAKEKPFRAENDSVRSQRFSAVHEVMMLCEVCMFHAEKRNLLLFLHSDARNRRDFFLYAFFCRTCFFYCGKKHVCMAVSRKLRSGAAWDRRLRLRRGSVFPGKAFPGERSVNGKRRPRAAFSPYGTPEGQANAAKTTLR